jgi:hypothetical protein
MKAFNKIFPLQFITLVVILSLIPHAFSFSTHTIIGNATTYTPPTYNASQNKVVILTFDDSWKSQYVDAKPILDKYGLKASFFVVCNYVGRDNNTRMNWQNVLSLQNDGMDIESHTMNHKNLDKLSAAKLDYEVGQSKQCLHSHGITGPTIMATPFNEGWNNATVIQSIAKYYDLARNGGEPIMYLHCVGWGKQYSSLTDCRTYFENGTLTFANRYSIRAWSHNVYDQMYLHNNTRIFEKFVKEVNIQDNYNKGGTVVAIPILEYHNVDNTKTASSTDIELFDREMKNLHDNGFKAIVIADLAYNKDNNQLYVKSNNTNINSTVA